ncbi:MAG TPA: hypothetical protein VL634_15145 [Mycobacterium sp.]|jgi:hypothetical protein|nr:hypothetical protein [Mycobacterium sp.]
MALADVGWEDKTMDWPTAAVLIATIIALMIVATTYITARNSNK